MKRKYINPKNCIVDLKLEELLCTSPSLTSIGINKDEAYTGEDAVEVRSQSTSFDWDNSEW